jgi:hypothetical protein
MSFVQKTALDIFEGKVWVCQTFMSNLRSTAQCEQKFICDIWSHLKMELSWKQAGAKLKLLFNLALIYL